MTTLMRIAGIGQLLIALANVPFWRHLKVGDEFRRLSPLVRNVATIQYAYIAFILAASGLGALIFPEELAGGGLGGFFSGVFACFWGGRVAIQLIVDDRESRRQHRTLDALFLAGTLYLTAVYAASALGGFR